MKKEKIISIRITKKDKAFLEHYGLNAYDLLKKAMRLERMKQKRDILSEAKLDKKVLKSEN